LLLTNVRETMTSSCPYKYLRFSMHISESRGHAADRTEQTGLCVGKMKALVLCGVPESLTKTLPAGEWVKAALLPLGGKCGPNPKMSQGQGPNIQKLPEALEAAEAYAVAQLKGWS